MNRAAWKTPRADRHGRLVCRVCGTKVKHSEARDIIERTRLCTCTACHERLDRKDSGWKLLQTPHGPRYHREVGLALTLDVEESAGSWNGAAVRDRKLVGVRCGLVTAAEAARNIEINANAPAASLPPEVCDCAGSSVNH